MRKSSLVLLLLLNATRALAAPSCPPGVFVTREEGVLAGVDWVEHRGRSVHTRSVVTQSRIIDSLIELRDDETAVRATTTLAVAGSPPEPARSRVFGAGVSYWSGLIPSAIEQSVRRARQLKLPVAELDVASPSSDWRGKVVVERVDERDWVVTAQEKRYEVLTDGAGCMLSASLPAYGVIIERQAQLAPADYAPWAPYGAPPDHAYAADEVSVPTPQGHVLAGTLTVPSRAGRLPAAVLITGLSPHERNNGVPPWMPLRDVADALTRAGFVVLRVDDRGVGRSTGDHAPSTTFDEADDVTAEVRWLRGRDDVDPARVALVGYSEGALVATMVGARDPRLAAVVLLDGTGVSGTELARYQTEAAVNGDPSIAPADREREIARQMADLPTARERVLMTIDPLASAAKVRCPALIVEGGSDRHVPPRSAEKLAFAMRAQGNRDVTVRLFPNMSHALLPDPIGLSAQWIMLPAFITSPTLLQAMTTWMTTRLRP